MRCARRRGGHGRSARGGRRAAIRLGPADVSRLSGGAGQVGPRPGAGGSAASTAGAGAVAPVSTRHPARTPTSCTRPWPPSRQRDRSVKSVCPYCAVGCGQQVYVQGRRVTQVEGDPDSPVSRGRLCPKGSATHQLVTSPRRRTWQDTDENGTVLRRTLGFASLGGATLDNEENYLMCTSRASPCATRGCPESCAVRTRVSATRRPSSSARPRRHRRQLLPVHHERPQRRYWPSAGTHQLLGLQHDRLFAPHPGYSAAVRACGPAGRSREFKAMVEALHRSRAWNLLIDVVFNHTAESATSSGRRCASGAWTTRPTTGWTPATHGTPRPRPARPRHRERSSAPTAAPESARPGDTRRPGRGAARAHQHGRS